jgi:hypothetical protein
MARIERINKARVRYPRIPELDAEGKPLRVIVKRRGMPLLDKHKRQVTRAVTREDRTRPPLPDYVCERNSGHVIKPGDPYKRISVKTGPRSSHERIRCAKCPDWNIWEYSNSLGARVAEIEHDFAGQVEAATSEDDVRSALEDAAQCVRDLAEEKREAAENMEEGFGHPTSQSEELASVADELEAWADEIEQADIPDFPDPEDADDKEECTECTAGADASSATCPECGGTGKVAPKEATEEQIRDWVAMCLDEITIVGECPV